MKAPSIYKAKNKPDFDRKGVSSKRTNQNKSKKSNISKKKNTVTSKTHEHQKNIETQEKSQVI